MPHRGRASACQARQRNDQVVCPVIDKQRPQSLGGLRALCANDRRDTCPSLIAVEGQEVRRWRSTGCWGPKKRWCSERKEGLAGVGEHDRKPGEIPDEHGRLADEQAADERITSVCSQPAAAGIEPDESQWHHAKGEFVREIERVDEPDAKIDRDERQADRREKPLGRLGTPAVITSH